MGKSTFNRTETKYRLEAAALASVRAAVEAHLPMSVYGSSLVSSIYLDTLERNVIARSLEKPLYKEKLRVRWYGTQRLEDAPCAFIELKKKFKGIVYKRRLQVSTEQADAFLKGARAACVIGGVPYASKLQMQIAREIDVARERAGEVKPSVLITCLRTSFGSDDEGALRITFDEHLNSFGLFDDEGRLPLLADGDAIMEAKCMNAYPSWLVHALSGAQAYPSSFSKYGAFYLSRNFSKGALHA